MSRTCEQDKLGSGKDDLCRTLRRSGKDDLRRTLAAVGFLSIAAVGFAAWRAWVSDDALITFRHVENCLSGYGPVFNPGERVQGFTHPLWFVLLLAGGVFFDVYALAVAAGLVLTALAVFALGVFLRDAEHGLMRLAITIGVLLASPGFVEYQTSGLESSLLNFLLVVLWGGLLAGAERDDGFGGVRPPPFAARRMGHPLLAGAERNENKNPPVARSAVLCALIILTRPDHILMCAPLLAWLCVRAVWQKDRRVLWGLIVAALPLIAWYAFATMYYGTLLPNTFYAKAALPLHTAIKKGFIYLSDYALHEPLHATVIILAACAATVLSILSAFTPASRRSHTGGHGAAGCLAAGIWLQLAYVVLVGGDFMRGRFVIPTMVCACLLACYLIGRAARSRDMSRPVCVGLAAGLTIACYLKAGVMNPLSRLGVGIEELTDQAFYAPAAAVCVAAAVVLLTGLCMSRLARGDGGRRGPVVGPVVLIAAMLVQSTWLISAVGQYCPAWMVVVVLATAIGASSYLISLCSLRRTIRSPFATTCLLLLLATVTSLCDVKPRIASLNPGQDISDEYAWWSPRWNDSRFRPPDDGGNVGSKVIRLTQSAARYARTHGPVTIAWRSMGYAPYYSGPEVAWIDLYGLTDAYIARCRADPTSRVGHIRHDIPDAYLRSRGVVNLLPDWQRRLEELDPTLVEQARAMQLDPRWTDDEAFRRWQDVQRVITGELFSRGRLRSLPGYAFVRRTWSDGTG